MKTLYGLITGIILVIQVPKMITLKEYYCGFGVIFNKEYKYPFVQSVFKEPFTPTITQLKKAEDLLMMSYYDYKNKVIDSFNSNKKTDIKLKEPKNVKKRFYKYYRQYAGYVNSSNDSIIYIGLFNFSNSKKASIYFEGWDKTLFLGSGEYYENNQESYLINLSKENISFK